MPALDPASPTGYAFGQRHAVLEPFSTDGYQWIMQAQQVVNGRGVRVHFVDWDNAPAGREAHWSSGLVWWLAGLAWLDHAVSGRPLPLAVEQVAPLALPILLAILLLALTPLLVRRFGILPAMAAAGGLVFCFPAYALFTTGYLDHHGLVGVCAALEILFLVAGGGGWLRNPDPKRDADHLSDSEKALADWLPARREARAWFAAAAILGAAALWISASSEVPVLIGIGLAVLTTSGWMRSGPGKLWRPDPTLWRLWGFVGALGSVFFYLLEYFPHGWSLRLEVNHPLYALAWLGAGDLLCRFCSPRRPDKSLLEAVAKALPGLVAVLALPLVVLIAKERVFVLADPFLWALHVDYISEFLPLFSPLLHVPWVSTVIESCHPLVALIALAGLLLLRIDRPWKTLLLLFAIPLAVCTALALQQNRWLGQACILAVFALAIAIFVATKSASPRGARERTLVCGTILAALLLLHPLYWPPMFLQSPSPISMENSSLLTARSLSSNLRQRLGAEPGVIVGGFTVTAEMIYFGGFRGLGTGYWENNAGLHATAEILGAATDAAALAGIQKHGITHIVDASWDFFSTPSARLLQGLRSNQTPPSSGFLNRLESGAFPPWVRPILAVTEGQTAMVYEVTPHQTPLEALVHNARFFAELDQPARAQTFIEQALNLDPFNAPALIVLAGLQAGQSDSTLPRLREALNRHPALEIADQIALSNVWLAAGDEEAARRTLAAAVAALDERELRRLSMQQLRHLVELTSKWNLPFPAGLSADFARSLLPKALRPTDR